jgi:tetratricopeptide (TPR) repeat protein
MKRLLGYALTSILLLPLAAARSASADETSATAAAVENLDDSAFAAGTQAMNEQRWPDAIKAFDQVISSNGSKRVDEALYWKAYSLMKISHRAEAVASCETLRNRFPASSWNADCGALSVGAGAGIGGGAAVSGVGNGTPAAGSDEDLKILALNALADRDPDRAIPVFRGILAGNQPMEWKKHALFALSQSRSPEAAALLEKAANGEMGAEVQFEAIRTVGLFEGKRGQEVLLGIYNSAQDLQLKKSVIAAFLASDNSSALVELARKEKNPELKRLIISKLAEMHDKTATDYMLELLK